MFKLSSIRKFTAFISNFSLLLNSFMPFILAISPVYAQDATPTEIVQNTPTPEAIPTIIETSPTVEPTTEPTIEPTIEPTVVPTIEPTIAPTITPEITPEATPTAEIIPTPTAEITATPAPADQGTAPQSDSQPSDNNQSQTSPTATETPTSTPTVTVAPAVLGDVTSGHVETMVVDNNSCRTDLLNPQIISDKPDYSPTEIAIISGSGFSPDTQYTLRVTSSDLPSVDSSYSITADSNGNFTYSYQLDGTYRPDYKVEIKDLLGLILATTTFTDSVSFSSQTVSSSCMADQPTSSVGSCTANDISIASVSGITIIGHGCRYPGDTVTFSANWQVASSSNERYNVGLWFATGGQTDPLHGQCSISTLPSTPSPFFEEKPATDTCGDINNSGIGTVAITMTATCNPDSNGFLKLPYCTSWLQNKNDDGSCSSPIGTLPGTGSKCNCQNGFTIPIEVPPSIEVIKNINPTNDSGLFNLLVNTVTQKTNAGNSDTTGKIGVTIGENSFGETAGTNTNLSNYTSAASCVLRGTTNTISTVQSDNTWTIANVTNGQDIVCTITNTRINNASITIIKNSVPNDAQDFSFTTTGGLTPSTFSLDDDSDSTLSNTKVFSDLSAGTYSISEGTVTGWTQTSAVCSDGSPISAISLQPGENITCTFTNTAVAPKLTVTKIVTNNNGGTKVVSDFPLFIDTTSVTSGVQNNTTVGSHTVSETSDNGYTSSISGDCASDGSITLALGDVKSCTVTNDDIAPKLTIIKTVNNNNGGDAQPDDFQLTVGGDSVLSGVKNSYSANTPYAINETQQTGYDFVSITGNAKCPSVLGGTVTLAPGDDITCTITNDDIAPKLTLVKTVTNNNGGDKLVSDFKLYINGTLATSGTAYNQPANVELTATEDSLPGYSASIWGGNCASDGTITLLPGDDKTCTITNSDIAPTLKLVKVVSNDYGGNLNPANWTLTASGNGGFSDTGDSITFHTVKAGVGYVLSESIAPGYDAGNWSCDTGSLSENTITLSLSQNVTCTITNNDQAAHLIIIKNVINDNGGTKIAGDFSGTISDVTVAGGNNWTGTVDPGLNKTLTTVGSYNITENADSDYNTTYSPDCSGSIALGQTKTCTVTNDDKVPHLIVIKHVINNNGGSATAGNFTMNVTGTNVSDSSFSGSEDGTSITLDAGTYSVDENAFAGYTKSLGDDCSGSIALGETKTCTITNDDQQAYIVVDKTVINDNGGLTTDPNDFNLTVDGQAVLDEVAYAVDPGTHTAGETNLSGYTAGSWGEDCNTKAEVTVALGQTKTCTITNDDVQAKLTVTKVVSNDHGGSKVVADFPLYVDSTSVTSGQQNGFNNGTYTVSETNQPGYFSIISGSCDSTTGSVTLNSGDVKSCTITNYDIAPKLTLVKTVVNDNSGDKQVSDFKLYINSTPATSGTAYEQTANVQLTATEDSLTGYSASVWGGDCAANGTITLLPGEDKTCTITNDDIAPKLTLVKTVVNDNGGGAQVSDFILKADDTNFPSGVTQDINVGTYTLSEINLTGYAPGDWSCDGGTLEGSDITLTEGQTVTCTITNDDTYGKVTVTKYNDHNGNGIKDENDEVLSGWDINLSQFTKTTDENGLVTFGPLLPGEYNLSETLKNGWKQTNISCSNESSGTLTLNPEQEINCYIGNQLSLPSATISKTNDASGDLAPGSSVDYKIKVVISGNNINDFKVTDLLSDGFKYRSGSFGVLKNGLSFSITEPVYHSPGVWNLGNLQVGDTLELSYIADISADQQPGKYTDLAWGMGETTYGDNAIVYATGQNSQYVNDNFVGTEVPVVKNTQNTVSAGVEKQETGQVLGASTTLPSTGSSTLWLLISALMSIAGLTLLKKSSKKLIIAIFLAVFFFPINAHAVSNLSVRLEQPKSPTNLNDLKLTFVALEINGVDPINVKCFKKGPSDGGYSQFGSDISLNAPGNTNQCQADSSILNAEGTYLFYVTANGLPSDIVSVDYKTSGPGTPSDYRKDHPNNCDYKIHFKTADDGDKTAKVELYRADITSFLLDAGSVVASVTIGSNQEYDFTNSVPDCSKNYYYVLRAFDSAGNGSGTIGDSVTITTTTTVLPTTSTTTAGAIPVSGTLLPTTTENAGETTITSEAGQVLGSKDTTPTFFAKYWKWLLLFLIIAASIGYVAFKKKRNR